MKQFAAFALKEFYHIMRDKRTMMILLVMPVIQIILFGVAISTEVKNVRVAVFDPAGDIASHRITEKINSSGYFNIIRNISGPGEMETVFRRNEADVIVVFEERFNENLLHTGKAAIQIITDGSDPNNAAQTTIYLTNIINDYRRELLPAGINQEFNIIPEARLLYNPQMKSAYNFVPGVMGLILMLICAMMTSISIVREKERGTMEVLLVSPVKPIYIILAKAIPYLALSTISLCLIFLLSVFVLQVPVAGSLFWLSSVSILFIMVALSMGTLISTLVNSQVAAMLVSGMGMMMPVLLLSGMIFPIESMPQILQWVSVIIPARWFIEAVRKIMIQGLDISYALKEIIILTVMAVILISVSLKNFKHRLE